MKLQMKIMKKITLASVWLLVSCASFANGAYQETEKLIFESIRLELNHNYSLRDPLDNQPFDIKMSDLDIFGVSVVLSPVDGSASYDYKVEVAFETLDGGTGTLLCSVPLKELGGVLTYKKASCFVSRSTLENEDQEQALTIDEILRLMAERN